MKTSLKFDEMLGSLARASDRLERGPKQMRVISFL
jgi:hypothetical protein